MLKLKKCFLLFTLAFFTFNNPSELHAQSKPLFRSPLVTSATPNHTVKIDVDIQGKQRLYLVVTDGGDGYSCDWSDWVEPKLVGKNKSLKLTELKWKTATSNWGRVLKNRNANNQTMSIAGRAVPFGIGTHANSLIVFEIPKGYQRFHCKAGLDDGGTDQQNGNATSVRFLVYTEPPPKRILASMKGGQQADKGSRKAKDALAGLDVADGLRATLFAAEPMLLSPTNIDIDSRGRVWVCEVVNYRRRLGTRKEGDRILILEDTDGDGVADKKKVFHQGHDIDAAMGICVLGNRVIVSCSPNVWIFTDLDGDDKADKKELLFSKTGIAQHDHTAHAFVFGPDGKLYWNFGNMGKAVHDKNGKPVIDKEGNRVVDNGKPYFGGMVFRCNPDGSEFEVLAHNFRNNYEVAVDSFGTLWQSDNDDDGNRGVRINYVMEHGNFGYRDEFTGASWQTPRTGMNKQIPLRHWHQNDPGVVPNLLQTGGGSPTGICVYEGGLLPKRFHNQIIHCDAGPNVVRAYSVTKNGAGYQAKIIDILKGTRDKWFRPSDVCIAPDGSIFVADWYDPGVGGHAMGDIDRGRIFRIAPPKVGYRIPSYDLKTVNGALKGLQNPNQAMRYLASRTLLANRKEAKPLLWTFAKDEKQNPRMRSRVLWLLAQMDGEAQQVVDFAIRQTNADFRILALRVARSRKLDVTNEVEKLVEDQSPQIRRECALALRNCSQREIPPLWAKLAKQHDGKDRWYLEALGIAAENHWDECLKAWIKEIEGGWNTPAGRDILWRSRTWITPEFLAMIVGDPKTPTQELPRYFRAFDFQKQKFRETALLQLAFETKIEDASRRQFIVSESLKRVSANAFVENKAYRKKRDEFLSTLNDKSLFVELVDRWKLKSKYPALLKIATMNPARPEAIAAVRLLLAKNETDLFRKNLRGKKPEEATATVKALGYSADGRAIPLLLELMNDKQAELEVRRAAVKSLCRFKQGTNRIIAAVKQHQLEKTLRQAAASGLHSARWRDVKLQAQKLFPLPKAKDAKPLPPLSQLLKRQGDKILGRVVFNTTGTCAKCHRVNGIGKQVGPDLSEIGGKLSKEAMFESILYPSAGISHNYETYLLLLESGTTVTGVLTNRATESITLKDSEAIERTFKTSEIEVVKKQNISLMPADLQKTMSAEELVNVIAYLQTLKKKEPAKRDTSQ